MQFYEFARYRWSGIFFEIDFKALVAALLIALACYFLNEWKKGFAKPHLFFSNVRALEGGGGWAWLVELPKGLIWLSLLSFFLAFLDPRLLIDKQTKNLPDGSVDDPKEGIAIYLVLDQSGSMAEQVFTRQGAIQKVQLLKEVSKKFILGDPEIGLKGRPNDLIGLIAFARGAHVLAPLTLDHAALLSELSNFKQVEQVDEDGTSIGYAIFKTATMISATRHYAEELSGKGEPAYAIKSTVMILITDGMQDPNPLDKGKRLRNMDVPEAAAYAKEQGIRLYIVNVEPKLANEEFAAYRHIMQRAAEVTGGKFYMVDSSTDLGGIYRDIDSLEKSDLPNPLQQLNKDQRPDLYRRLSFYSYLIAAGLVCLLLSQLLESTLFRRVP